MNLGYGGGLMDSERIIRADEGMDGLWFVDG